MLRSNLCDYSEAYIIVKGTKNIKTVANNKMLQKDFSFKNNFLFRSCISRINNTFIYNPEELDIYMPMCNLLEYSDNYSITPKSL